MENKKLTLEEFKAKAIDKFKNRKIIADIDVKGFGIVPFQRPSDNDLLEYLNGAAKGAKLNSDGDVTETDIVPVANAAKILVYKCCSYLHDIELQEEVEAKDPYETAFKVFGVNGTIDAAEKISDEFDTIDIQKDIKN